QMDVVGSIGQSTALFFIVRARMGGDPVLLAGFKILWMKLVELTRKQLYLLGALRRGQKHGPISRILFSLFQARPVTRKYNYSFILNFIAAICTLNDFEAKNNHLYKRMIPWELDCSKKILK